MKEFLTIVNLAHTDDESLSVLYVKNELECFIIQDEPRVKKVIGNTRLRDGVFPLKIRNKNSGMHERYKKKFTWHKGMIEIITPDFTDTYFHIGNTEGDTDGCPLCNAGVNLINGKYIGVNSTVAYNKFYQKVIDEIIKGDKFIEIKSVDL